MRIWERARRAMKCGGPCGGIHIEVGDPMLVVRVPGVKTALYRCVACAGEPVPTYLPRSRTAPAPKGPIDVKVAASGEREPGEDDD
jgi:hypothetical protein